jgi:hypothetical protein
MNKKLKDLNEKVNNIGESLLETVAPSSSSLFYLTKGVTQLKTVRINERLKAIEDSLVYIKNSIWELQNPFKFKVGDLVVNNEIVYKIISIYYIKEEQILYNKKCYETFDCINNVKKSFYENDLTLYKEKI